MMKDGANFSFTHLFSSSLQIVADVLTLTWRTLPKNCAVRWSLSNSLATKIVWFCLLCSMESKNRNKVYNDSILENWFAWLHLRRRDRTTNSSSYYFFVIEGLDSKFLFLSRRSKRREKSPVYLAFHRCVRKSFSAITGENNKRGCSCAHRCWEMYSHVVFLRWKAVPSLLPFFLHFLLSKRAVWIINFYHRSILSLSARTLRFARIA